MTLCAFSFYFEVILAALATIALAVTAMGAAYVATELNTWRRWRGRRRK